MTDIDWDNLPQSTRPATAGVTVKGELTEQAALRLGREVLNCVHLMGSFMDLTRLDGVTVATDYDGALAELDRGMEGLRPLSRTNSEIQGVAMSPAVMRDGEVRTHLVFDAAPIAALALDDASSEDKAVAIQIIAHECAHVQVTAHKEAAIPEARFGTRIDGYERAILYQIAEICWDEYAACRISALFAAGQTEQHRDSLISVLAGARENATAAIKAYRWHGDIDRVMAEAGAPLQQPMKVAAYLLGGMDGAGLAWSDVPEARAAICAARYENHMDDLHRVLQQMWDNQDAWAPSLAEFDPLMDVARAVFADGGIHFETASDGVCRIQIPFTAATMPF